MQIRIVRDAISKDEVTSIAHAQFGDLVKAVVDVDLEIMALGGELHADEEATLLEQGSRQQDPINLYPGRTSDEWIEFDSMINVRPAQGNRSRDVENLELRRRIGQIVTRLVTE